MSVLVIHANGEEVDYFDATGYAVLPSGSIAIRQGDALVAIVPHDAIVRIITPTPPPDPGERFRA